MLFMSRFPFLINNFLDNKKHFSQFSQIFPGILWTIYVFSVPVSPSFNLHCLVCAGWSELKFLQSFLWQTESLAFSWQKNSGLADCKLLAGRGRPSKVDSISLTCLHELQGSLFPHFSSSLSQWLEDCVRQGVRSVGLPESGSVYRALSVG